MFKNADKYSEYVKAYNDLGAKFEEINLSDELWDMFHDVCMKALHLDLAAACREIELSTSSAK